MRLLVTGGAGFIGSNFIRQILNDKPDIEIVNLDKLTYAGNLDNLTDIEGNPRYQFIQGDVADPTIVQTALTGCQAVVHFAAETHVDRSITGADPFLQTNVIGTHTVLKAAREQGVKRFVLISTDEVYGPVTEGAANETAPMQPSSPYAASKAAADHLTSAYYVTYDFPIVILRASNNYGPYQFPEKFLPVMILRALEDETLPIYGDGKYVREWLHVEDFCSAIQLALDQGVVGEAYNVGTGEFQVNLEVAQLILTSLNKPLDRIEHVADRLCLVRHNLLCVGPLVCRT